MKSKKCIWCLNAAGGNHVEHIVPESLGCPENFVLPADVICKKCNNGMGHLDQAVADDFDMLAFQTGIPRKKGRLPKIASRGNVYGFYDESGPKIFFNMENRPVTASDGTRVGAYKGQPRNIKASFEKFGNYAKISADFYIGKSKKFQRGIYKIAVSALAYYVDAAEIYRPKYNAIRNYVRNGKGKRHIIFLQESDFENYEHEFNKPYISQSNNYIITFRLACARMIVDLSENESELPKMIETFLAELGETGWTVIPLGLIKE